ncbi:MAG: YXWGXW repeat-containing protein [Proteobacteria bacterium]|nr:YXWGXW repeat-containing protein [Pseudomonadota bacterium]
MARSIHRRSLALALALAIVVAALGAASPANAFFSLGVSVGFPPPPLPVYAQPACPGDGFLWVPGYWAYDDDTGYYWVPGTWMLAPSPGLLWTPGYWAWNSGGYVWNAGYWGPHVGFYGGINYGFGYFGSGFVGGYWSGEHFRYNGAVTNISSYTRSVTNVYYNNVGSRHLGDGRVSFQGGAGGTHAMPSRADLQAAREPHRDWTTLQRQHADLARSTPALASRVNHGQPTIAATPRAALFNDRGVARARGAPAVTSPHYSDRPGWASRPAGGPAGRDGAVAGYAPHSAPAYGGAMRAAPGPGTRFAPPPRPSTAFAGRESSPTWATRPAWPQSPRPGGGFARSEGPSREFASPMRPSLREAPRGPAPEPRGGERPRPR